MSKRQGVIDRVLADESPWALAWGNSLDVLRHLPDSCVDAVIADAGDLVARYDLDLEELRAALYLDMMSAQPVGIAALE